MTEKLENVLGSMLEAGDLTEEAFRKYLDDFNNSEPIRRENLERLYKSAIKAINVFDIEGPFEREFVNFVEDPEQIEDDNVLYATTKKLLKFIDRSAEAIDYVGSDFDNFFDCGTGEGFDKYDVSQYDFLTRNDYVTLNNIFENLLDRFQDGIEYQEIGDADDFLDDFEEVLKSSGRDNGMDLGFEMFSYNQYSEDDYPDYPNIYYQVSVNDYEFYGITEPVYIRFRVNEDEKRFYPAEYCICLAG